MRKTFTYQEGWGWWFQVISSYRLQAIFTQEVLWSQPDVLCLLLSDCVVTMATHRSLRLLILLLSLDVASPADGPEGKTTGGD